MRIIIIRNTIALTLIIVIMDSRRILHTHITRNRTRIIMSSRSCVRLRLRIRIRIRRSPRLSVITR